MDILSHGLWGSAVVGRKGKKSFWLAFFFGVAPDLFSFGIFTASVWLGFESGPEWQHGPPDPSQIPSYVYSLYNVTHSLFVFLLIFGIVFAFRKKPMWEMSAWGFHVLLDIFTHSERFFPTPFLWPISDFHVNGQSWGTWWIFLPNVALLALVYAYWGWKIRKHAHAS